MSLRVATRWDQRLHAAAAKGNVAEIIRVLDTGRVHVDCCDREGTTPLILAAANGHYDCVHELLDQGGDATARRCTGTGALFFAAQSGYLDILTLLLDSGAPINMFSKDGGTALIVAAQSGHYDIVMELLKRGADPRAAMKDRASAAFLAAQNGHTGVLRSLLLAGADPTVRRTDGTSPLWIAAQMGHDSIVKLLIAHGASVDTPRHDGATPLFKACHKGHIDVVRELLPHKPFLGLLRNGESALHASAAYGHLEIVKVLVNANASCSLKNENGLTPIAVARNAGHDRCAEVIQEGLRKQNKRVISSQSSAHDDSCSPRRVSGRSSPSSSHSKSSSRSSSLGTILEASPVLPRSVSAPAAKTGQFASCELSGPVDSGGPPKVPLVIGSCSAVEKSYSSVPSPSPSISSEPNLRFHKKLHNHRPASQTDINSVKNFFNRTFSSFRRNSISRKLNKQKHEAR